MAAMLPGASDIPADSADLKADSLNYVGEGWLHAPSSWFAGRGGDLLFGTGEESRLRERLDSIGAGDFM